MCTRLTAKQDPIGSSMSVYLQVTIATVHMQTVCMTHIWFVASCAVLTSVTGRSIVQPIDGLKLATFNKAMPYTTHSLIVVCLQNNLLCSI